MNVRLHDLLTQRAESVEPPALDPMAEVARGERRLRRRRRLSAAGAALALAVTAGTTTLVLDRGSRLTAPTHDPSRVGPTPGPDRPAATGSRPRSYGQGQVIHLGDRRVDTGLDYVSLDITDDGAAFTTLDGRIWFNDGTGNEMIGATLGGVVHQGGVISWVAGRPPDWVVNDSAGSLLAWVEYPAKDLALPELVVYDSAQRGVILREPVDLSDQEASSVGVGPSLVAVAAVAGRDVFVAVKSWQGTTGQRLLRYDVNAGTGRPVTQAAYEAARRGVPRALVVGPSVESGRLMLHGEANRSSTDVGGWLVVRDSRLDQLFDPHTGDRLDVLVPPGYEDTRLFFVQWLDDNRFTLIAGVRTSGGPPTGDLLSCRIAAGRCTVTIDASTWTTPPLLPGTGGVGAEFAQDQAATSVSRAGSTP